jgi:hypothetical protein
MTDEKSIPFPPQKQPCYHCACADCIVKCRIFDQHKRWCEEMCVKQGGCALFYTPHCQKKVVRKEEE